MPHAERRGLPRRAILAAAALTAGAAAPLLGTLPATAGSLPDADALYKAGDFAAAERAYRAVLRRDRLNARANAQVGQIALLSNRFRDAEEHLSRAITVDPGDQVSRQRLAECFVRQDRHGRAIPLLRATGRPADAAFAEQFAHLPDRPWQVCGRSSTRLPFHAMEPVPSVWARVNGGEPRRYLLDTFATIGMTGEVAEAAGIRSLATTTGRMTDGTPIVRHLGVVESFTLGDIELRGVPVQWTDLAMPPLPDGTQPAGAIGTLAFYHLLATMDYAGRALVLRRKTPGELARFKAEAARSGYDRLPLWLAGDHFPCSLGKVHDYGPRVVTLDTGGIGHGVSMGLGLAAHLGIEVGTPDPARPFYHPLTADSAGLGRAVAHDVAGWAGPPGTGPGGGLDFDTIANFSHTFYRDFAMTFDYRGMGVYMTGALSA
ncbi:MAG TPA: tetratricopeptide repeat protein [Phytomonospora sp.]